MPVIVIDDNNILDLFFLFNFLFKKIDLKTYYRLLQLQACHHHTNNINK